MSRTFIQLCQDVASDLGVTGGVITATAGLTSQEQIRIVNWVSRADLMVQNLWSDWEFLWNLDYLTIPAGNQTFTTTKPFNDIDHKSLVINPGVVGVNPSFPVWTPWSEFFMRWRTQPIKTQPLPVAWSVDPSGNIQLSHMLTAPLPAVIQYWMQPVRMVNNQDTSLVPTQYDNIICERAKMMYAERENAPEILSGSGAEYDDILDKLQSAYLPSARASRKSENDYTTSPVGYVE